MGTNFVPLVADIFLYKWNFKLFPSESTQADVIEAFISTSRYLADL